MFSINLGNTFSSVRDHRGLQLYLLSQAARLWGWAALQVAISWLVYSATKSSLTLAWVTFGNFLPMLLFGMTGGYVADRFNRRIVLLITQTLNALFMLGFAFLAVHTERQIWMIAMLYVGVGIVYAHDQPVRNALIMNLIPPSERVNAFCSDMILSTLTMMVGYASAGLVVAHFGESQCFLLAALAFIIANAFVIFIHPRPQAEDENFADVPSSKLSPIEALNYVCKTADVRRIFSHNSLALLFGTKYSLLFPSITMLLLHGSAKTLGYLDAANSIGGTLAGLILMNIALRPKWGGPYAAVAGALLLFVLAISGSFGVSALTVVFLGFCFTLQNNGNYAVLQTIVPDRIRGRVIAVYLIATQLVDQSGNLIAGWLAGQVGVRNALIIEGGICALVFIYICYGRFIDHKLSSTASS